MDNHIDSGSLVVAVITLILFVAALFTKGLTHDLFLEAGVFLVSVKIILMAYRTTLEIRRLDRKLDQVLVKLERRGDGYRHSFPALGGPTDSLMEKKEVPAVS
jgi:hypothetical protein